MRTLRFGLACLTIAFSSLAVLADAATYTLTLDSFRSAVQANDGKTDEDGHFRTSFTDDDVTWNLELLAVESFLDGQVITELKNSQTYVQVDGVRLASEVRSFTLSTNSFAGKKISSVRFNAAVYRTAVAATETETSSLTIGDVSLERDTVMFPRYLNNAIPDRTFTFKPAASGDFVFNIRSTIGGQLLFRSLEVTFEDDGEVMPEEIEVRRRVTVPVGHAVVLEADEGADIYYTVDGSERWVEYDAATGVTFGAAGVYTLKYYADYMGAVSSGVITEEIDVVEPWGLAAALAANGAIEVSGVVVGHTDAYTLIADTTEADPESCLAIDHAGYAALSEAREGDVVTAVGRPTDRFGSEVKGLSSISSLSVNNEASTPTSLPPSVVVRQVPSPRAYDLHGRPATAATAGVTITPADAKTLRR